RAGVVAGAEREPSHLLKEMGPLDRIVVLAEQLQAGREAGAGALAIACFPWKPADLPLHAGCRHAVAVSLAVLSHRFVVGERFGSAPGEPQEIGKPLVRGACVAAAAGALGKGLQRAVVVADRVVVGVHRARPVAGGDQVARSTKLVRAEAPVVTEGFEIAQPLGPRAGRLLERAPDSFVELGPTGQQ